MVFFLLAFFATIGAGRSATFVQVQYAVDDALVASAVYTGGDGWKDGKYWALLAKRPEAIYEVEVEPDEKGGKVATLKGRVTVRMTIRNSKIIATVTTKKLVLRRDKANSENWYLGEKEMKRLAALAGIELK